MAPYPNLIKNMYHVLVTRATGEKTYEPLSVLEAGAPVKFPTYDGWTGHNILANSDKHNLSSPAPPKGEMKSSFTWTSFFKSPTSSTLCFGEPTLGKLHKVMLLCTHDAPCGTLHLQSTIKKLSSASPSTFLFVSLLVILEFISLFQDLLLKQTEFPTDNPT